MQSVFAYISSINEQINNFIWGPWMLIIFLAVGLLFTIRTGFFQIRRYKLWLYTTIFSAFRPDRNKKKDASSISPFQSLCTALAGTLGTGNIAGVATAITAGGPGAIFWMWVSAFLGMMTHYAEVVLGIHYRYKNKEGEWVGGAMVYMEKGLNCRWLASLFAFFCMLASLGIGNMTQANSMATALEDAFSLSPLLIGLIAAGLTGLVIIGGIQRIARVTEKIIPLMAGLYTVGAILVILANLPYLSEAVSSIFYEAFTFRAAGSGVLGYGIATAMRQGISKGVFSNEAGLGSSVIVHTSAETDSPVAQGMWGIFEVFADTIVMCTITALAILTSGVYEQHQYARALALDAQTGGSAFFDALPNGAPLTSAAFTSVFGPAGGKFVAISITLFAFATLVSWSFYGEKSAEYLFGKKIIPAYKLCFIFFVLLGCLLNLTFVWSISDTFNGLMAVPNLIAITLLSGQVIRLTKDHLER